MVGFGGTVRGSPVGEQENRQTVDRLRQAYESGDLGSVVKVLREVTADDFVQDWPQSGERIRGRDNSIAIDENYPTATGTNPAISLRRFVGGGDVWVAEGTIDYGDGTPVSYVSINELRDGKVVHSTEYFANPFPAPEWRSRWVERMESGA